MSNVSLIQYKQVRSLGWVAQVGDSLIRTWKAMVPGDFCQRPVPMICIEPRGLDYLNAPADDLDMSSQKSFVWYRSKTSKLAAERIALELANSGVAVVYPCDKGIAVQLSAQHQIAWIGEAKPVER